MVLCVVVTLIAPTLIRAFVDGAVHELGFAPYVPFVLVSAVLLDWRVAAAVALSSAVLGDFLFVGRAHELLETPTTVFGLLAFATTSALLICLTRAFRKIVADSLKIAGSATGIVFSLKGGQVYASWYGGRSFVPMGAEEEVARMMEDFLAQRELGRRLGAAKRSARQ